MGALLELNRTYNEDCLETMKRMPDGFVDLAWFDPPYNVGKDYGPGFNDSRADAEYLDWMKQVIAENKRVARAVCVFVPTKYALWYWNQLGPEYKQIVLTWSPEGTFRGGFVNQFSFLLTNAKPTIYCKNVWHNCQTPGLGWFFRENTYGHPGYTSEDVTARVIHHFTNPGETVWDSFHGTGTTGTIATRMGRNWIASEINADYCRIAEKRINAERVVIPMIFAPVGG